LVAALVLRSEDVGTSFAYVPTDLTVAFLGLLASYFDLLGNFVDFVHVLIEKDPDGRDRHILEELLDCCDRFEWVSAFGDGHRGIGGEVGIAGNDRVSHGPPQLDREG
jgi:hypothetical protein